MATRSGGVSGGTTRPGARQGGVGRAKVALVTPKKPGGGGATRPDARQGGQVRTYRIKAKRI
jgi:hypothetical protein